MRESCSGITSWIHVWHSRKGWDTVKPDGNYDGCVAGSERTKEANLLIAVTCGFSSITDLIFSISSGNISSS